MTSVKKERSSSDLKNQLDSQIIAGESVEDDQRVAARTINGHSPKALLQSVFREERFFLVLSVFIGIFSGLAVVCFRFAIGWCRLYLLGSGAVLSPSRLLLAPTLAGLVIAVLVIHVFPRTRGSGVNQTKAALYIYNGYIPVRTAIGKFITAALAIGSGHSLGPEDPSLQIGACLASVLGRKMRLVARPHAADCAGGRGGGTGGGVQRADFGGAVRD